MIDGWLAWPRKGGGYTRHFYGRRGERAACGKPRPDCVLIAGDETRRCEVCVSRIRAMRAVGVQLGGGPWHE